MKKTLYTTKTLFNIINNKLKEENLLPDILDYGLASYEDTPIKDISWDVIGVVNFGGSEGIYLDISLKGDLGDNVKKAEIATYKTLDTSKEAFKAMSILNSEFVFAVKDFVNEHVEEFNWTGYDVVFFRNEKKILSYWTGSKKSAEKLLRDTITKHHPDYAVITNNETGKEMKIQCIDLSDVAIN